LIEEKYNEESWSLEADEVVYVDMVKQKVYQVLKLTKIDYIGVEKKRILLRKLRS